jgi:phage terminase large subunit GpA-like protein
MLSPEASAEAGRWYTSRTPYLREIMDATNDPAIGTLVVESSSQVGKTETCLNIIGFHIHQEPAPMLLLEPTLEMAEAISKDRVAPMIRDTAVLTALIGDPRARSSENTLLHKRFPGGHLTLSGANSAAGLSSRPIRILLCDEVDRYPASAGAEGDPVALAVKRTTTFWNRLLVFISSPTIEGLSRIDAAFEASDKRFFHVPCYRCGKKQKLEWEYVRWEEGRPRTAVYVCRYCGTAWNDQERYEAIHNGEWVAER